MSELKQLINSAEEMIKNGESPEKVLNALLTDLKAYEKCNGWIPVSERLPEVEDLRGKSLEECTEYLIQRRCGVMDAAMYIKIYGEAYFLANSIRIKDVVAWQPLPEPWKGEDR